MVQKSNAIRDNCLSPSAQFSYSRAADNYCLAISDAWLMSDIMTRSHLVLPDPGRSFHRLAKTKARNMRRNLLQFARLNVQHRDLLNRHERLFRCGLFFFFSFLFCRKPEVNIKKEVFLERMKFSKEDTVLVVFSELRRFETRGLKQPEITEGCEFIKGREALFHETAPI